MQLSDTRPRPVIGWEAEDIYTRWRHLIVFNHCAVGRAKRQLRRLERRREARWFAWEVEHAWDDEFVIDGEDWWEVLAWFDEWEDFDIRPDIAHMQVDDGRWVV